MQDKNDRLTPDATDQLLESALSTYGATQPLQGLEARLLISLRQQTSRRAKIVTKPLWAAFSVAAAFLLVASLYLGPVITRQSHRPEHSHLAVSIPNDPAPVVSLNRVKVNISGHRAHAVRAITRSSGKPFVAAPLSGEERLLLQLAATPNSPLPRTDVAAPIVITPIQISAINIKPLTDLAPQDTTPN